MSGRHDAATLLLAVMWAGLTAYALFGGADFGAGFWDLLAGGAAAAAPTRRADRALHRARCGRPTTSG